MEKYASLESLKTFLDNIKKTFSDKNELNTKSDYIGAKIDLQQEDEFYCKICTITIPNEYSDIYIEFDLVGRTIGRFQTVKFACTKLNSTEISASTLRVSGNNNNCYEVEGYHYVSTSDDGDIVELWCKVPPWDTLNVLKKQLAGSGEAQNWIVWNLSKHDALPTTSDSLKLISAVSEAWSGNALTATTAFKLGTSTVGGSSSPIYLNSGIATEITAVGTNYGGTGATNVSDARTNLDVYSKSEIDIKFDELTSNDENEASGEYSNAEGYGTTASGKYAHAEGQNTVAEGFNSHAEGDSVQAISPGTHAEGKDTVAGCKGYYYRYIDLDRKRIYITDEQPTIENPPTIVTEEMTPVSSYVPNWAVGTGIALYNEATLWGKIFVESISEGIITYSGELDLTEIYTPESMEYDTFAVYAPELPFEGVVGVTYGGHAEGYLTVASGNYSHAEGGASYAIGHYSHVEGRYNTASGGASHAEGSMTIASGVMSHAEGRKTQAIGDWSHAEGDTTKAIGNWSHAEGSTTEASGMTSHAEGLKTIASGAQSHAEGRENTASGNFSHAEGRFSGASGNYSHAENRQTLAKGENSHAEGFGTIARGASSHAQGKFNIEDTENKYAHIVGNGTAEDARSNAHTLDWNGNAWYAGSIEATNIGAVSSLATTAKDSLVNAINENVNRLNETELKFTDIETNKKEIETLNKLVTYQEPFSISFAEVQDYITDSAGTRFYMSLNSHGENWKVSEKSSSIAGTDADNVGVMRLFLSDANPHFRAMSGKKDYVFNFTSPSSGKYSATANLVLISGGGKADIYINDTLIGSVDSNGETTEAYDVVIGEALLKEGELANELKIYATSSKVSFIGFSFEDTDEFNENNHEYRLKNIQNQINNKIDISAFTFVDGVLTLTLD